MNCLNDKGRVEMISRMENALMTMARHFETYRNGSSPHLFGYLQFDHYCSVVLAQFQLGMLEDTEVLGLYSFMRPVGYNLVSYLLEIKR